MKYKHVTKLVYMFDVKVRTDKICNMLTDETFWKISYNAWNSISKHVTLFGIY